MQNKKWQGENNFWKSRWNNYIEKHSLAKLTQVKIESLDQFAVR